jgi:hypothetical protein
LAFSLEGSDDRKLNVEKPAVWVGGSHLEAIMKVIGFILFCVGVVTLPVPAMMLFGVSYGTALSARPLAGFP